MRITTHVKLETQTPLGRSNLGDIPQPQLPAWSPTLQGDAENDDEVQQLTTRNLYATW